MRNRNVLTNATQQNMKTAITACIGITRLAPTSRLQPQGNATALLVRPVVTSAAATVSACALQVLPYRLPQPLSALFEFLSGSHEGNQGNQVRSLRLSTPSLRLFTSGV